MMQGVDSTFTQNLLVDESIVISKDKFHSSLKVLDNPPPSPPKKLHGESEYMLQPDSASSCVCTFIPYLLHGAELFLRS